MQNIIQLHELEPLLLTTFNYIWHLVRAVEPGEVNLEELQILRNRDTNVVFKTLFPAHHAALTWGAEEYRTLISEAAGLKEQLRNVSQTTRGSSLATDRFEVDLAARIVDIKSSSLDSTSPPAR